jgi:hypothetical protein
MKIQTPPDILNHDDIWEGKSVYIKGFYGWTPETWAAIGFSNNRRETLISNTTDPFIMIIYVTENAKAASADIRGKIVGFYIVSHQKGHRNEFTDPIHFQRQPEKWQNALKAVRAFSFLPEYQPHVYDFDPSLKSGVLGKSSNGVKLDADKVEELKLLPYVEVPIFDSVYKTSRTTDNAIRVPSLNKVQGGPQNRSGYTVEGEPLETEKELYALCLDGDTSHFLGEPANGRKIYKIGLSLSPRTRLLALQKSLPEGAYSWNLHRSTRTDGHPAYPNFEAALKGEDAMKNYLGQFAHAKHLGGEFYAATEDHFQTAWRLGREAALQESNEKRSM